MTRNAPSFAKISDQRIRHTIYKVILRRIVGEILEWQDCDRCDC